MKKSILVPLILMALIFTASIAADKEGYKNEKASTEFVAKLPTAVKLHTVESYKVDDAEFKAYVVADNSVSTAGFGFASVALVGFFALFGRFIKAIKNAVPFLAVLAVVAVAFALPSGTAEYVLATVPLIPFANQLKALREEKSNKVKEMNSLISVAETEKRDFNATEQAKYDALKTEVEDINKRMARLDEAHKRELEEAAAAGISISPIGDSEQGQTEKQKIKKRYSITRAANNAITGRMDGVEGELAIEERKSMQAMGLNTDLRAVQVPAWVLASEKRDMTAGTVGEGGYTVQTDVQSIVDVLLPMMVLGQLPVQRFSNLTGNLQFPKATTAYSANWATENGNSTEKSPAFGVLTLSPKRLTAFIQVSNMLMQQSSASIDTFVRNWLLNAQAIEFEKAALKGGGSNEPSGIIAAVTANVFAGGAAANNTNADGAAPVWADIVNLYKTAALNNVMNATAYITSPKVIGKLQNTPRQSSGVEGNFILPTANGGANGFPMYATTNLPDTFAKGNSTTLSAIIFGDFSKLALAAWGGIEIGVDPYTNMQQGQTNLVLNSYVDAGVLNLNAFSLVKDVNAN